jgi:hypothetical protein
LIYSRSNRAAQRLRLSNLVEWRTTRKTFTNSRAAGFAGNVSQTHQSFNRGKFTMLKLGGLLSLAAGLILTAVCLSAPAQAHPVAYVSGKGTDKGDCSTPVNPCRSFQFAVNQTPSGGRGQGARSRRLFSLDPADYSPVTINKSITITGVQGAGIDTNGGTAVTITGAANVSILLDHLTIKNVTSV